MILRDFKTFVETLQRNVSTPRFIHLISNASFTISTLGDAPCRYSTFGSYEVHPQK
ncbi:hypothetical protein GXM_02389 [Nostoc sphaeroides CCNUC1]|uniref:Uncharacterized protein n=1 Tax=Nostoc sphaeroides CCNUC1 TaxID=2653204 RepID=A0A5P8VX21_9NOSO|nr:hypothetical protein GXM_02389 [Nostoc sphaeroides CCNUC1]